MTEIRDYNGIGRWSRESVESRFKSYSKSLGTTIGKLEPKTHEEGSVKWIYPSAEAVVDGIKRNDPACIELAVELIEDSASMPFGMILKSNAARALRRSLEFLTDNQRERIRKRVTQMLVSAYMPREFLQYVKLARAIGFENEVSQIESEADLGNRWVRHYLEQLQRD